MKENKPASKSIYSAFAANLLIALIRPDLATEDILNAIERIRNQIKKEFKLVQFVIIQPQA